MDIGSLWDGLTYWDMFDFKYCCSWEKRRKGHSRKPCLNFELGKTNLNEYLRVLMATMIYGFCRWTCVDHSPSCPQSRWKAFENSWANLKKNEIIFHTTCKLCPPASTWPFSARAPTFADHVVFQQRQQNRIETWWSWWVFSTSEQTIPGTSLE